MMHLTAITSSSIRNIYQLVALLFHHSFHLWPALLPCEMRAPPQRRGKFYSFIWTKNKKKPKEKHKNVLFRCVWESWLSTDRSTAFFAHTLFCPIPSNLNSILKSWMRVVVFIRSCFHRCHRNVCAHELWVILTAPDACTILPHLSVSNIYIVVIELANCNLRRQLRFGFSFFFSIRCSLEWEKNVRELEMMAVTATHI